MFLVNSVQVLGIINVLNKDSGGSQAPGSPRPPGPGDDPTYTCNRSDVGGIGKVSVSQKVAL